VTTTRTILGFGASSMQGTGDSHGGFFVRLARQFQSTHPDWNFINLGIGGNTTRDMLKRIDEIEPYRPFTSIVMLGCNDLPREWDGNPDRRTTLEEYTANVTALLPRLATAGSLFVSSFQPDHSRTGVKLETMDQYMAAALMCAQANPFQIWDLFNELRQQSTLTTYWAADGLHFNDAGHAFVADRLASWLTTGDAPTG